MNSPYLKESHHNLREQVREFAEKEIRPVASELDEKAEFSVDLTRKMGKLGLLGLTIPEEYGGTSRGRHVHHTWSFGRTPLLGLEGGEHAARLCSRRRARRRAALGSFRRRLRPAHP